jgi:SurA N-terminal domain/PPIC-type PPIASE domain
MTKKITHNAKRLVTASKQKITRTQQSAQGGIGVPPRITNDTVAEHREEVLSSARKYIYPLQHSKHRIVTISIALFALALVIFFTYTLLSLYKFQTTSTFVYRVTQIIPFPVARAGSDFVAYENYLFQVRRYTHYYQTQQDVDFDSQSGKDQLAGFKKRALQSVITDAYVKQLAKEKSISVSRGEVNDQIALLRAQNRLGGNDQVFEDVLKEFWGWSVADFRRQLQQELLTQKVVASLDTEAQAKAKAAEVQLAGGADFAAVAKEYSEDEATKAGGGEYGAMIERSNREIPPQIIDELFKLQPGQTSRIIQTPTGLEIVKIYENSGGKVRAAHILFKFQPIENYTRQIEKDQKTRKFIGL